MRLWPAFVIAAIALAPTAWGAPRRGVVARVAPGVPLRDAELAEAVAAAVREGGAEPVRDPAAEAAARRAAGAVSAERLEELARARKIAAEGWRAHLRVEPVFAEARLVDARYVLEAVLDLDGALELLADVSLRLGAVRLGAGRPGDAQDVLALAAALDPDREPSPQEFSPDLIAAYRKAAGASRAQATLEVLGPPGASVELDGRPVGVVPWSASVSVGEHVVVLRAPGRLAAGQIVAVRPAGATVELPLDEDGVARALARGDAAFAIGLEAAGARLLVAAVTTYAELDDLLLVGATWRGGQLALLGQRCDAGGARCGAIKEVRVDGPAQLASAARELVREMPEPAASRPLPPILFEDTRLTEPEPPPHDGRRRPPPPPPTPWWKSAWVWIGAGTVAAVVTGGVLLLADEPAPGIRVTVPGCEFVRCP